MSIEEKLGFNKFYVDESNAHIIVKKSDFTDEELVILNKIIKACPAGLYSLNEDGTLRFDYAGCLECGTCRILAQGKVIEDWKYPQGTFGVEFRYG
ncbi:4Fe-4S dicluster domain-containing protein [Dehalobacterium formicoaceticum]|uniref:Ferredoxin-like protein n=1 Tax=Dehalobacterium formicoaceticum TaxID=51515 RepID=A0ABT1YBB5_9FIRM|nr:4Fe-4S dicluster domain-containing protein [Dehalobacterium formicoaceticum]MCR6546956.1 4Fe-4S dicluster domain-containing protein [Dehalobacterium formicoaceticum]